MEEENVKLEEIGIGEDTPQVTAKKVLVMNTEIKEVQNKEGKTIGKKLTLFVKHPDIKDHNIEVSGVKYQFADKLKESGLWVNLDKDNKIPYKSAVAHMLRSLDKKSIKELVGIEIPTVADENGYLLVKAY